MNGNSAFLFLCDVHYPIAVLQFCYLAGWYGVGGEVVFKLLALSMDLSSFTRVVGKPYNRGVRCALSARANILALGNRKALDERGLGC